MVQRLLTPISPANAGAQIQPERLGMTRCCAPSVAEVFVGSIWAPAFAGEVGLGNEGRAR
jgi:hypothetical protein